MWSQMANDNFKQIYFKRFSLYNYLYMVLKLLVLKKSYLPNVLQAALVIRGFDFSRTQKPQITGENCSFYA
jgi:hypothetical protein